VEIVRVGGSDELTVEMVGSVRRDIEAKSGEGVIFVGVGVGVCYIGFGLELLFFSHRHCTTTVFLLPPDLQEALTISAKTKLTHLHFHLFIF